MLQLSAQSSLKYQNTQFGCKKHLVQQHSMSSHADPPITSTFLLPRVPSTIKSLIFVGSHGLIVTEVVSVVVATAAETVNVSGNDSITVVCSVSHALWKSVSVTVTMMVQETVDRVFVKPGLDVVTRTVEVSVTVGVTPATVNV